MPSVEEAAVVVPDATATKVLLPKVADCQLTFAGNVRRVQVIPSVEEAAVVEPYATVTKVLLPKVADSH